MIGGVPRRVDAATKSAIIELIDQAIEEGWTLRRAAKVLGVGELRLRRWRARQDRLDDLASGGNPVHGLLTGEIEEILALAEEWGPVDRSHRKLAHRGSYLGREWVGASTVLRVLPPPGTNSQLSGHTPARSASRGPTGSPTSRTACGGGT